MEAFEVSQPARSFADWWPKHRPSHVWWTSNKLARLFLLCGVLLAALLSAVTDCVGQAVQAVTDQCPEMSVLSIDGIGSLCSRELEFNAGQDARSACSATPLAFRQTDVCTGVDLLVGR